MAVYSNVRFRIPYRLKVNPIRFADVVSVCQGREKSEITKRFLS